MTFGELAINFDANDPGLFTLDSSGAVRKIGPVNVSLDGPTNPFSKGEVWYDEDSSALRICTNPDSTVAEEAFDFIRSLPPTGTSGIVLYVSPSDPLASDSLDNNGLIRPFLTLNRACLEVVRQTIEDDSNEDDDFNKFTILVLPGEGAVYNAPGLPTDDFSLTDNQVPSRELTPTQYESLNPVSGGLVVPRGTSIIGSTPLKCRVHPTYIPLFEVNINQAELSSKIVSEPSIATFKATGGSSFENMGFYDKQNTSTVREIGFENELTNNAVFYTKQPHSLRDGDMVTLTLRSPSFSTRFASVTGTVTVLSSIAFKIILQGETTFLDYNVALESDINPANGTNILVVELLEEGSHHLVNFIEFVNETDLDEYYEKVRSFFGKRRFSIFNAELQIGREGSNIVADSGKNPIPFINNVVLRSNLGLCGLSLDGSRVEGSKAFRISNFNYQSYQSRPECYQVYGTFDGVDGWQEPEIMFILETGEINYTDSEVLNFIFNNFGPADIRLKVFVDQFGQEDEEAGDSRYYAIKGDKGSQIIGDSVSLVGGWPGLWAKGGARISIPNSSFFFGNPVLSEGFLGIGTTTGANTRSQGFAMTGVVRPRAILVQETLTSTIPSNTFVKNIVSIDATTQRIELTNPLHLEDYEPEEGDVITVLDSSSTSLTAVLKDEAISSDRLFLTIDATTNQIVTPYEELSEVTFSRLEDPRSGSEFLTKVRVESTNLLNRPPIPNQILRLSSVSIGSNAVKTNVQLDPVVGGINQVFVIMTVEEVGEGVWDLSLLLCDDVKPYFAEETPFFQGQQAVKDQKLYFTDRLTDIEPPLNWGFVGGFLPIQNVGQAYQGSDSFNTIQDNTSYPGGNEAYARGSQWLRNPEFYRPVYNGSAYEVYENEPSRKATKRLLRIFGYTEEEVNTIVTPQAQVNRFVSFLSTGFVPSSGDESGYLQTNERVPVEFNNPSQVICPSAYWRDPGYFFDQNETQGVVTVPQSLRALSTGIFGGNFLTNGVINSEAQIVSQVQIDSESGQLIVDQGLECLSGQF